MSVGGVFVSKSGKRFGSFWLRGFQERVLGIIGGFISGGVGPGVVLVSAPTGAGKSLCLLLGYEVFREAGLRGFGCLGLYPSNELLDDQFRSVGNIVERALGYGLSVFGDWRDRVFRLYVGPGGEKLVLARISGRILGELGETGGFRGLGHLDMLVRISGELMRIDPDYSVVLATPDLFYYVLLGVYGDYERTARYISSILEGVEPRITGLKDRLARLGTVNLRLGSKPIVFFDEYHSWGLLDYLSSLALVKLFVESGSLTILSTATPIPGVENHLEALDVPVVGKVEESGSGGGDLVKLPARITFYGYGRGDAVEAGRPGLINIYTVQKLMPAHVRRHGREAVEYAEEAGAQALVVLDRISYTLETSAVLEEMLGADKVAVVTGMIVRGSPGKALVITGNKAIELGIDNPRALSGIIAAKTYSSLIQRIGRIGRRRYGGVGEAHIQVVLSEKKLHDLVTRLGGRSRVEYRELASALNEIMPSEPRMTYLADKPLGRAYIELLLHIHRYASNIIYRGGVPVEKPRPPPISGELRRILRNMGDKAVEALSLRTGGIQVKYRFKNTGQTRVYDLFTILRNFEIHDIITEEDEPVIILEETPVTNPQPIEALLKHSPRKPLLETSLLSRIIKIHLNPFKPIIYSPRTTRAITNTILKNTEAKITETLKQQPATITTSSSPQEEKIYKLLTYTSTTIPAKHRNKTKAYILLNKNTILPYILKQ